MNRGSDSKSPIQETLLEASMRPRFMNRGSALVLDPRTVPSFRFNEAPIHESGKSRQGRKTAQGVCVASMRPRFMNRGSPDHAADRVDQVRGFNEAPIHESGKSECSRVRPRIGSRLQ